MALFLWLNNLMTSENKFLYIDGRFDSNKEIVLNKVVNVAKQHFKLPDKIIFEMRKLGFSTYGETIVDPRYKNRIKLNIDLGINETVYVLTHEIIHLSQITTGQLAMGRNGSYVWDFGYEIPKHKVYNLSYAEYLQLPWEADVVKKQQFFLEKLLKK